jgi:DNA-binding response OmpR family regulator
MEPARWWLLGLGATCYADAGSVGDHYKMRVLVVEDEPLLSMLLEESVTELGHELAGSAATVDQALETLAAGEIDLALLDFSLGQETTSVPVAERLRAAGIPFIFLSGHHSLEADGGVPNAPLLTKPFSLDQLDNAIRSLDLAD